MTEQPDPPPASALKAEHVEYVAATTDLTPEEAAELKKAELVELEQAAGQPADGDAVFLEAEEARVRNATSNETPPERPAGSHDFETGDPGEQPVPAQG